MRPTLKHPLVAALVVLSTLAAGDPGVLRITTSPGDAQIFINGQRKGNSPEREGQSLAIMLTQGEYRVEARKSDDSSYYLGKKSVYVANDTMQSVNLKLNKIALPPPPQPYGNQPNGSITLNGREWLRCSVGQSWNGSTCIGKAKDYTFDEAQQVVATFNVTGKGGKRDWRLPTVRELQSLRACSAGFDKSYFYKPLEDGGENVSGICNENSSKPTLNTTIFPNTPVGGHFAWSPVVSYWDVVWHVDFGLGSIGRSTDGDPLKYYGYVRLVRTSQ